MKKANRFLIMIMASQMVLTGCSKTDYDSILLTTAANTSSAMGFNSNGENPFETEGRYFTLTKTEEGYLLDVNGDELQVDIAESENNDEYVPLEATDAEEKYQEVVSSSKKLIYQYIDASKILKNKKDIKKYIDGISIKEADYTDKAYEAAYFSYKDDTMYINKKASFFMSEWMLCHEYVHAIAYFTHDKSIDAETYAFRLFNEIITDMITASMSPEISQNTESGYAYYYYLLSPYFNLFGIDAIEAYFYGYDIIYDKIDKNELDFFVLIIDNSKMLIKDEENNYISCYNNLIYKWYSQVK